MKKVLGLDLGTNSIGWALIEHNFNTKDGKIIGMGSRIIPMSQDIIGKFAEGSKISQTAERTRYRIARRLRERYLLRRERLHRVLNVLGFLPSHFAANIDFEKRLGQFINETEPKLAYNDAEFLFKASFQEMLEDFRVHQPSLLLNEKNQAKLIPYDWTIYYLRKKALSKKIEKEELAWILLNFNQKRGYYQARGEDTDEAPNKLVEFHSLKITDVKADERQNSKEDTWYSLFLENGWVYRRSSKTPLFDWVDKTRDFVVTTDINEDGTVKTDKEGNQKRSFRAPGEDDWTLLKKKTEKEISEKNKFVGSFIYDALLANPNQKIKGKLVRTIERKFYKEELRAILIAQTEFHPELRNKALYADCVRELYRQNDAHQLTLSDKNLIHLFLDDIIFFQRPLKSKKTSIGNCNLEYRKYTLNGVEKIDYLKAIPKSHPLYQEFRIWKWLSDLAILKKDDDTTVTHEFLSDAESYTSLYEFLHARKEIAQSALLKYLLEKKGVKGKTAAKEIENYRWNFVEDKIFPCNETGTLIRTRLSKTKNVPDDFLTPEIEEKIWHIVYSVKDKIDYEKALKSFASKNDLDIESFVESFKKFPPFASEYGAYSLKATKKLLQLLRLGGYWSWEKIDEKTRTRIENLLSGEFDETIQERVRKKAMHLTEKTDFQGLPEWLAKYVVYDRHSEASDTEKWNSAEDLKSYLHQFKQHSLRNPIVEQIITEALRVVQDIWLRYGNGASGFFDEIHIELGRDMKNTADERKRISSQASENENTNLRIKSLLVELANDRSVENVRPYSPMQQEALKIYEEGILSSETDIPDYIQKISNAAQPSSAELQRYKLWMEQRYRSPYTGDMIPLNKLFTPDYEIEHIIPQSRFFDDSFSNKVICESAINKLKDHQLAFEFIKNHHGQVVETGNGKKAKVFDEKGFEDFVKIQYAKNRSKRAKLLLEEIPEQMIERQLNDTRYISKFVSSLLSKIVRADTNDDGPNSKNIIPGNGKITTTLRQDWGLNDVWNDLITPRFERMNELTKSSGFLTYNEKYKKYLPTVPLESSKGFQKKRIDHRHHALDALVIACCTRDHINLLNNKHAKSKERFDLNRKLRAFEQVSYVHSVSGEKIEKEIPKDFLKPWKGFTIDAKSELGKIVVSFKQNLRVINKTSNKFEKWVEREGIKEKESVRQTKGESWAIRKPMHKETISGLIKLRREKTVSLKAALEDIDSISNRPLRKYIRSLGEKGYSKRDILNHFKEQHNTWKEKDISKVSIYFFEDDQVASRVALTTDFDKKKIESITDTGIQKILLNHLAMYAGKTDEKGKEIEPHLLAFSPEGIEEMNKNIIGLNDGKFHQPILRVRTYEQKGNKFVIGETGNKKYKYAEAAKGTNLFFAIYLNKEGKRSYETIPLNVAIERQKQGLYPVPEINSLDEKLLMVLSPNDLVYVPTEEERLNLNESSIKLSSLHQTNRIYKFVSCTGNEGHFVPHYYSREISKNEMGTNNKSQNTLDGLQIKLWCVKCKIDRIGNISLKSK